MIKISLLFTFSLLFSLSLSAEPNPPTWPGSVYVFDPATPSTTQSVVDSAFSQNGGHDPAFNGEFSSKRFAFLFKPGYHNVNVNVGYYTSVIGLGRAPTDTQINTVTCENGDFEYSGGALANFWRSAENFYTKPSKTWNNNPTPAMLWAVSQASPLRKVYVEGDLTLFQYNYGCCAGYASGGYLSDSTVTGTIISGSQQQWLTRNTKIGNWDGGNWNMVFVGNSGSVPSTHCSNSGGWPITTVGQTPLIAEKPYIIFDSNRYYLVVPNVETNKVGPTSNYYNGQTIDFNQVYVASEKDSVQTINSKLSSGLHLILTPGNYNLTDSIQVTSSNTVVLGIGFPTLIAANGKPAIVVTGKEGVRVGGILFQAGPVTTSALLVWGKNDTGSSTNPGVLSDCFARVGGTNNPNQVQMTANAMVQISQGHVVIDNAWLWRADHGVSGLVYNSQNRNNVGLQVYADDVIAYSLASEHQLQNLVEWNGERGKVFFYQSELPYDVTQQNYGDMGYVGFKIGSSISNFNGYGMGVYSYFRDNSVTVENGIQSGSSGGIKLINSFTVFLNGKGKINHVVNYQGSAVSSPAQTSYICNYN